jgi:hypothetical protein
MRLRYYGFCCVLLFFPSLSFSQTFSEHDTSVGPGAIQVVKGDFNSDSIPDFATANQSSNTVSVFLMNANGTFRRRQDFTTGQHPTGIVAGDFNHDHKPDLATSNADPDDSHSIALLIGNGDGTFQAPKFFYGGTKPVNIGIGDFNKDGNLDVVTGFLLIPNPGDPTAKQPNEILVTYGDGRNGFSSQLSIGDVGDVEAAGERDRRLRRLAVGDFNGDGRPDIAFIEGGGGSEVFVGDIFLLVNRGTGFMQKKVTDVPDPNDITVNDVNQDGLDDILLARFGCPENDFCGNAANRPVVDYFRNSGDGTFSSQTVIDVPGDRLLGFLNQPTAADLNGDGLKDIAVFSEVGGGVDIPGDQHARVSVAFQQPNGSFVPGEFITNLSGGDVSGALVDVNRDGKTDMLVSGSNMIGALINTMPTRGCIAQDQPRTVQICLPGNSPASSPVQILANTRDTLPIEAMKVYVDGVSKFFTKDDLLSGRINMPVGTHLFEVKAWDRKGAFGQAISFTVGSGCIVSGIDRTVKICTPANGATVASPVHIEGTFGTSFAVNAAQIYVDGVLKISAGSTQRVDTSLPMSAGKHRITLKGWDNAGQFSQTINIIVQ